MHYIHTDHAPAAIGPYSQAIVYNGIAYLSGQIPLKADGNLVKGGIKEQTEQVFTNLAAVLEASKSNFSKVIKATVFLDNMDDFVIVNEIYAKYFGEHKPARAAVAVKTLPKNVKIEIECIAAVDE